MQLSKLRRINLNSIVLLNDELKEIATKMTDLHHLKAGPFSAMLTPRSVCISKAADRILRPTRLL